MGKKNSANTNAKLTDRGRGYLAGKAEEKKRCADIALNIWKKKPAKDAEWYKTVGREIAAEIWGFEYILPSGIPVLVDDSLEEDEVRLVAQSTKGRW